MIKRKEKICKGCGEPKIIWARGKCKSCDQKDGGKGSQLKRTPIKAKKPEPSGELALFQSIWAIRPHKCVVCKENLQSFDVWFFSHILSKGAFPKFRLYEKNIVLKCRECHHLWETQPNEKLLKKSENWEAIIELHDKLVTEYYQSS